MKGTLRNVYGLFNYVIKLKMAQAHKLGFFGLPCAVKLYENVIYNCLPVVKTIDSESKVTETVCIKQFLRCIVQYLCFLLMNIFSC